jgi:type IV secretion system protein VirB9
MKHFAPLAIVFLMAFGTSAQSISEDELFSENPVLTEEDEFALEQAKKWTSNKMAPPPVLAADGSVVFVHGAGRPTIVCAVLDICDIQLQPGEVVNPNGVHIGDSARWELQPAVTGTGATAQIHVIAKPLDAGLETSLVIATDRRVYNLQLRSHRTEFMPKIKFAYQDDAQKKWEAIQLQTRKELERKTIPQTGENIEDLDFNYNVTGKAPWKPVRVYNNGLQTIIQLPKTLVEEEAPVLIVLRENPGFFSDDEEVLPNSRLRGDRIIVDQVFRKAALITGAGDNQTRVIIERDDN